MSERLKKKLTIWSIIMGLVLGGATPLIALGAMGRKVDNLQERATLKDQQDRDRDALILRVVSLLERLDERSVQQDKDLQRILSKLEKQ